MSNDVVITIRISLPEGARVGVTEAATAPRTAVEGPTLDSVPWSPDEPPFPGQENPVMAAARQEFNLVCPTHKVPWKTVPAGVSKKDGKPYASFQACPERDCRERPR